MFNHHGLKFKPLEIWFLANTKDCFDRILHIGFCPVCQKDFTCLIETSKKECKTYRKIKNGKEALKEIELCEADKLYTKFDIQVKKGKPCGICHGLNTDLHSRKKDNKGAVIGYRQRRCDRYGQTEIVKESFLFTAS